MKKVCCHEFTWRYDDYGAKEANLGVGELEPVDPLREVKDGVHQRLGVARRHLVDGVLANDVTIEADQSLQRGI